MCYFNIYEEKERGSYNPGFFQMKLSFPFNINDLSSMSLTDVGTFAHEYIHFLQNTSTPFGLWQAMIQYQNISEFFAYIQGNGITSKPVQGYVPSDNTKRRIALEKEASGYRGFLEVKEEEPLRLSRSIEEICGRKIERISISFRDIQGRSQKIILGANIIKESMAALIQEIINPGAQKDHSAVPYHVVSRLAAKYAPNIAYDIKKLITLSFISLHTLSPGITLINYMAYANDNPHSNIISIFDHFLEDSKVHKSNGDKMTVEQLGDDIAAAFKDILQSFIYGKTSTFKLQYLAEIIDRVKISSGMIPLLRLLTENDIDVSLVQKAVEACGTPIVWNEFGDLSMPNTTNLEDSSESPDFEVMALITSQALYKYLANPDTVVCPMILFCQSVTHSNFKDECYDVPWRGQECLITPLAKSIGLE